MNSTFNMAEGLIFILNISDRDHILPHTFISSLLSSLQPQFTKDGTERARIYSLNNSLTTRFPTLQVP